MVKSGGLTFQVHHGELLQRHHEEPSNRGICEVDDWSF